MIANPRTDSFQCQKNIIFYKYKYNILTLQIRQLTVGKEQIAMFWAAESQSLMRLLFPLAHLLLHDQKIHMDMSFPTRSYGN